MNNMRNIVLKRVLELKKFYKGWQAPQYDCETFGSIKWRDLDIENLSDKDLLNFYIMLIKE